MIREVRGIFPGTLAQTRAMVTVNNFVQNPETGRVTASGMVTVPFAPRTPMQIGPPIGGSVPGHEDLPVGDQTKEDARQEGTGPINTEKMGSDLLPLFGVIFAALNVLK